MLTVGTGTVTDKNGIVLYRGAASSVSSTQAAIFNELNGIATSESITLRSPGGFKFQNNDGSSEWMRLNSTGLGIGTSSPAYKLDVAGSARFGGGTSMSVLTNGSTSGTSGGSSFIVQNGGSSRIAIGNYSNLIGGAFDDTATLYANGNLRIYAGGIAATFDSSGNLGLGVTPSAWYSSNKAIQIGSYAALESGTAGGGGYGLFGNAYEYANGSYKYLNSYYATMYLTYAGQHQWYTAPSGTAGNTITFTQAMTLDASGNLGVGTTSPGAKLHIEGGTENAIIGSSQRKLYFRADSLGVMLGTGAVQAGNSVYFNEASNFLYFQTASTERARITSGGQFVVNNTTAILDATLSSLAQSNVSAAAFKSDASTVYAIVNIWGNESSGNQIFARFATDSNSERGSITYNRTGGLVAYNTTSDYRAKDIIGPVTDTGATIDALKVYEGKMKGATKSRPMLVAHEAQEVTPYAVTGEKDAVNDDGTPKYQQMDVSSFVPLLIAEIQSLRQRVSQLEGA
ncbi:MAG: hypothetical protein EBR82_70205 [Caulobacteraceae bacterium]|nr:hypothetical protein [Caulobacteraceae bacterium]